MTSQTLRAAAKGHEAAKSQLSASHAELETQLAVARADAERLRWVRLHISGFAGLTDRASRTHAVQALYKTRLHSHSAWTRHCVAHCMPLL